MPDLINERQVLKLLQSDQSALLVNTSGGKDSDAMLKAIWDWAQRYKISPDRTHVIHAHLGRNEWSFALEHVKKYTRKITGKDPIIVERPQAALNLLAPVDESQLEDKQQARISGLRQRAQQLIDDGVLEMRDDQWDLG